MENIVLQALTSPYLVHPAIHASLEKPLSQVSVPRANIVTHQRAPVLVAQRCSSATTGQAQLLFKQDITLLKEIITNSYALVDILA